MAEEKTTETKIEETHTLSTGGEGEPTETESSGGAEEGADGGDGESDGGDDGED